MAMGIFQQLAWLTTTVKRLCCAVKELQEGGGSGYKVYRATLSTSGGGDPVVTVLENTLSGPIVWTKNPFSTGLYEGVLIGAFPDVSKVHILYNNRVSDDSGASLYDIYLTRSGDDGLVITTWNGGVPQDDNIPANNPLSIEIKVYP
jgi:TFIIF-interacting CTD phosphatase-like protein